MATTYNYQTKAILGSNVDLNAVFPERQEDAKIALNVDFGLRDTALFLQTVSGNWTSADTKLMDMDNAISSIIAKYYKSTGADNPFADSDAGKKPKTKVASTIQAPISGADVNMGKVKTRGLPDEPAPAPAADQPKLPVEAVQPKKAAGKAEEDEKNKQVIAQWEEAIETYMDLGAAKYADAIETYIDLLSEKPNYSKKKIKAYRKSLEDAIS
jgi:hypothetical protein